MATVTDSSEGTGRQDEALRPEQSERKRSARREREGEKDGGEKERGMRGGQPAMRMLRLSAVERACLFVCVRQASTRQSVCVCVCVCVKEEEKESGTQPCLCAALLSSWLTPPIPSLFCSPRTVIHRCW